MGRVERKEEIAQIERGLSKDEPYTLVIILGLMEPEQFEQMKKLMSLIFGHYQLPMRFYFFFSPNKSLVYSYCYGVIS